MTKKQAPRPRPTSRVASNSRARYMDFAPRKPKTAGVAAKKSVPKKKVVNSNGIKVSFSSASSTQTTRARVAKPVRRVKPVVAKVPPVTSAGPEVGAKPVTRVTPVARAAQSARLATKKTERPVIERQVALESQEEFIDTSPMATEEYVEAIMEEPVEISTVGIASDANNSPFISSVNVDKRPLSARRIVAEDSYSGAPDDIREEEFFGTPHAHNYTNRREREAAAPTPQVSRREAYGNPLDDKISKKTVSPTKDKIRSLILVFAIALTIVLGVAVGAFIYLAFFQ